MRGDISPLTPERDDKQAEQYSTSAFGDAFPTTPEMPCRVPTGFMPPPPVDHFPSTQKSRSNTPQMQGNPHLLVFIAHLSLLLKNLPPIMSTYLLSIL